MDTDEMYNAELEKAFATDISSVTNLSIVHVYKSTSGSFLTDGFGNKVVVLTPALVPSEPESWEKSFKLFLRETAEVVNHPYRIIVVNSRFSSPVWFAWWSLRLRSRVSRDHRKNLKAVTIVHPTLSVRFFLFTVRPFISIKFWDKLHYADRIEELVLDNILPQNAVNVLVPRIAFTYEAEVMATAELERQALVESGAPLAPREVTDTANVSRG